MRRASGREIHVLAGHKDLATTQRCMHLSPAAIEGAIRLLDRQGPANRLLKATAVKKPDTTYDQKADDQSPDVERYWRRQISNPLSSILSVT